MKKRFVIEIEVDEKKCPAKYPNFRFNYEDIEEFIESEMECCGHSDEGSWERYGYVKRLIGEVE